MGATKLFKTQLIVLQNDSLFQSAPIESRIANHVI